MDNDTPTVRDLYRRLLALYDEAIAQLAAAKAETTRLLNELIRQ